MLTPEELRDICNEVRAAGGADPIKELVAGIVSDPRSCLIARNLNFECFICEEPYIYPSMRILSEPTRVGWVMVIDDYAIAQKISTKMGWPLVDAFFHAQDTSKPALKLPQDLAQSAIAFDAGEYDDQYYDDVDECRKMVSS